MLAHVRMPTSYWVEAFNVALYLINRLSTHVLEYVSPYEKLFHHSRSPIFFFSGFLGVPVIPTCIHTITISYNFSLNNVFSSVILTII